MSAAKKIHQWTSMATVHAPVRKFRIVALADRTPGYEDTYVIEEAQLDALGGERWIEVRRWDTRTCGEDDDLMTALVHGITDARADAEAVRRELDRRGPM